MADYKPLLYSLAIIFIIGVTISLTLDLVDIDLESETEGTYIIPFVNTAGVLIDGINIGISFISGIIETILSPIFSIFSGDAVIIEVENTGLHEGYTLDGFYAGSGWDKRLEGAGALLYLDIENGTIINATIRSSLFTFWIWTYDDIYKMSSINGNQINLFKIDADYNFNNVATATIITEIGDEETSSFTQNIREFFDEIKEYVQNQLRTFGLIPAFIGLPLILLILTSLFYGVYKIIRP